MGQQTSSLDNEDVITNDLSALESKCLKEVLGIDDSSGIKSFDQLINNLKLHFSKHFSSDCSEVMAYVFEKHCNNSKIRNKAERCVIMEIIKITHGTTTETVEFVFQTLRNASNLVATENLKKFLTDVLQILSLQPTTILLGTSSKSCQRFVDKFILHNVQYLSADDFMNRFESTPNVTELIQYCFKLVLYGSAVDTNQDVMAYMPTMIPVLDVPPAFNLNADNTILSVPDVIYLNNHLPLENQRKWKLVYSTSVQGESFSQLSTRALDQGPLLIIVRDQGGNTFGGFISTNLSFSSQFQGNERSFLFTIDPELGIYNSTGYNDHYAYMNMGQETIPNGLGMGGQHNYFGMWLSSDFGKGHSKAKPKSTTYASPQLSSSEEFLIEGLEAWAVGSKPKLSQDEEGGRSVIDKHPDAVAILQIAGKERHSEGLLESEATSSMPETTEMHLPHDPMEYP